MRQRIPATEDGHLSTLPITNGIIVRQSPAPAEPHSRVEHHGTLDRLERSPLGAVLGGVLTEYFGFTLVIVGRTAGTAVGLGIAPASRLWRAPTLATLRAAAA
ncbi:MAG: hypothetical protein QM628_01740 [Propionicimonas sp.]